MISSSVGRNILPLPEVLATPRRSFLPQMCEREENEDWHKVESRGGACYLRMWQFEEDRGEHSR